MATSRERFSYFSQLLTTTGQPEGPSEQAVDGSITPVLFRMSPPTTNKRLYLTRLIIVIRDSGIVREDRYGSLPELTNGVDVGVYDDETGDEVQTFSTGGVKKTADWGSWCYDVETKTGNPGDTFILARWSFFVGIALILDRGNNHAFGVRISDDLTGLVSHSSAVQGSLV